MLENQVGLNRLRLRAAGISMIIISVKPFPTAGGIKSCGGEKCLDNFAQSVIRQQIIASADVHWLLSFNFADGSNIKHLGKCQAIHFQEPCIYRLCITCQGLSLLLHYNVQKELNFVAVWVVVNRRSKGLKRKYQFSIRFLGSIHTLRMPVVPLH